MRIDILLVEDSPGEARLTQEAFRHANRSIRLHVATDSVEAMAFLRHQGDYVHAPRPDLILLDLNLPKIDGREVLAHIKGDDSLKAIPTAVLATSEVGNLKLRLRGSPQHARRLDTSRNHLLAVLATKLARVLQIPRVKRPDVGVDVS